MSHSTHFSNLQNLKRWAKSGEPDDQYELARIYAQQEIEASRDEAFHLYEEAATGGHHYSLMQLVENYRDGDTLSEPFLKALTKSAKESEISSRLFYARVALRGWDNGELQKELAVTYLKDLAQSGNATAQFYLSELYFKGEGVPQSKKKSRHLLNQTAQKDVGAALRLFLNIKDKASTKAFHFAEVLARNNYLPALYYLCFHRGTPFYFNQLPMDLLAQRKHPFDSEGLLSREQEEDLAWKAFDYMRNLAEKGMASAQIFLADCYTVGEFIPENSKLGFQYYQKAGEHQNPSALFGLGRLYLMGKGVERDIKKGEALIKTAANLGHIEAWMHLGFHHSRNGDADCYREIYLQPAQALNEALQRLTRFHEA